MTISHKSGNIHKNADGLSMWDFANTPDNPAYVPLAEEPQITIEGIRKTDIVNEFFEVVRNLYKQRKNCHILKSLLEKDCKDTAFGTSLDEIWKTSYYEGRFHFFDFIIYHRTKHCGRTEHLKKSKTVHGGRLGEKKPLNIAISVTDYKKANRSMGKEFGLMIHIQEPTSPWEVFHMDWVTVSAHDSKAENKYDSQIQ
ncbi:hypothetical protein O181_006272 [Austropuccinia psidii MF-1]|uniref:Uncharacterized protein n=1 Tax=Austropuccinia psidii MF-1 TaxID=1389203 RepID=A0A9Q3GHG1_9BASI|nr:hypothetical protein [Austropuccinia psidii MF-1]